MSKEVITTRNRELPHDLNGHPLNVSIHETHIGSTLVPVTEIVCVVNLTGHCE